MSIFNSIKYGLLYGSHKLYETSNDLDILLIYLKEYDVKNIKIEYYNFIITFNDGTEAKIWNSNKYYAWMSEGVIIFSNGKKFTWSRTMPRFEVLYKFKKLIKNYNKTHNDMEQFLPLKLQRKLKLKKLK